MQELFLRKYWEEEGILFYLHFQEGKAVRQIEIASEGKVYLTLENPIQGESMLYDQSLDELEVSKSDFITKEEFDIIWNKR